MCKEMQTCGAVRGPMCHLRRPVSALSATVRKNHFERAKLSAAFQASMKLRWKFILTLDAVFHEATMAPA